jgi:hypothetical protein
MTMPLARSLDVGAEDTTCAGISIFTQLERPIYRESFPCVLLRLLS